MASGRTNKLRKAEARAGYGLFRRAPPLQIDEEQVAEVYSEVVGQGGGLPAVENRLHAGEASLGVLLGFDRVQRFRVVREDPALLPPYARRQLALIPPADFALSRGGASWPAVVMREKDIWADGLRDGLDQFVEILWMLRSGLTVGAAVSARHFLERWTFNIASSHDLDPKDAGESDEDYVRRVWSFYGIPHSRDQGADWAWLSELLHGREVHLKDKRVRLVQTGLPLYLIHSEIVRILEYPLLQVRGSIRQLRNEHGDATLDRVLSVMSHDLTGRLWSEPDFVGEAIGPADFLTGRGPGGLHAIEMAREYRDHIDNHSGDYGEALLPSESLAALLERVGRRFENAEIAFGHEKAAVGDRFDYGHVAARLFRYLSIASMARLVATDPNAAGHEAIALAGSALDSAWHLWLEDSDLVLPTIRVIVEQTAVARVHRRKPHSAAKLDAAGAANGPFRWVDAAGWGRLAVYVRALGEFSHVTHRSRIRGARSVLETIQDEPDNYEAQHGARREALDEAAYMLAFELAERLDASYPATAKKFREEVTLLDADEHERDLEEWLNRAMGHRSADFGEADYGTRMV